MIRILRMLFVFLGFILRPIINKINFPIIIAVNAGTNKDLSYFNNNIAIRLKNRRFYLIGLYRITRWRYGLVVGTSHTNSEILESKEITSGLINDLDHNFKARKIALTGILTSAAIKHDVFPFDDKKFVLGTFGTQHLLKINVKELLNNHPSTTHKAIGIVGFGHTGKHVAEHLNNHFDNEIIAFDTLEKNHDVIKVFKEPDKISECGLVIFLTGAGNDAVDYSINMLNSDHVVLSDTHPKVDLAMWKKVHAKGSLFYECGSKIENGRFIPKLPRWGRTNLLGCVMQSIVESTTRTSARDITEFEDLANKLKVTSNLEVPRINKRINK